ncbi:virulence surface antigen [Epibacterium ulvae]|uniref:Virulence surface antigen n=1 Tax=Epibacterium ulvae TaxID=1156985 RepID=A0A1G5Q7G8_9RHOB|nr:YopT-type cysteine protease domain-containing protein [Epibacterium ulvae]SCZ57783.1 virulence surface antigen [Epibacterium ulvae]
MIDRVSGAVAPAQHEQRIDTPTPTKLAAGPSAKSSTSKVHPTAETQIYAEANSISRNVAPEAALDEEERGSLAKEYAERLDRPRRSKHRLQRMIDRNRLVPKNTVKAVAASSNAETPHLQLAQMKKSGFFDTQREMVKTHAPIPGICLGRSMTFLHEKKHNNKSSLEAAGAQTSLSSAMIQAQSLWAGSAELTQHKEKVNEAPWLPGGIEELWPGVAQSRYEIVQRTMDAQITGASAASGLEVGESSFPVNNFQDALSEVVKTGSSYILHTPNHAMALYKEDDGTYGFYDPNYGVFESKDYQALSLFVETEKAFSYVVSAKMYLREFRGD